MIRHIEIENFAIIEGTEVDFEGGFNVITGETGAGKSIVIEAMNLALGGRADSSYVRHGKSKAKIQMLADDWAGEEYIIAREISSEGKNLCRINGNLTTRSAVSDTAEFLADIHGQYDNQKLLNPENHLSLVDRYHGAEIKPFRMRYDKAYENYKKVHTRLNQLLAKAKESRSREDFLRFELKEIEDANLKPGEDELLADRFAILENSEKIYDAANTASQFVNHPESGALLQIGQAKSYLERIQGYSSELETLTSSLNSLYYDLEDLSHRIKQVAEACDFQPQEVDHVIQRLETVESLKKKYGASIEEILQMADSIRSDLDSLEHFDEERNQLEEENRKALKLLKEAANQLTEVRKQTAEELSKSIEKELLDLNFQDAKFNLEVRKAPALTSTGQDECEIMLSLNKGEPMKPLVKTASGGEISHIMLAIKNITAKTDFVPAMIFDEIDTGISGITASIVARKLREISKKHQIICITHLPQIAAAADHNYRIFKSSDENATYTHVEKLSEEETVNEIARLLGGENITETTKQSARELIETSHSV